ncbi:hypothetical protein [Agrobacterium vaccinii]|uniref:hypothetical protein n=1 Tax=Agrobacterium vaccinii TaxID=2735528 RepID=UPI001E4D34EF|nr:hypothetical protein [Agrobacterium vaccinii]UHS55508.1 hypothetical protein HRS00_01060 [Agrobacterium vaccinii]
MSTEHLAQPADEQPQNDSQDALQGDQGLPDYQPTDEAMAGLREELSTLSVDDLQNRTNDFLNSFRADNNEAQQEFLTDAYVETGIIPTGEAFRITPAQAATVEAGFIKTLEAQVFSQYGLTHAQWMDHVEEGDLATFRRAAMKGDFSPFHRHAEAAAKLRRELGI